MHLWNRCRLGGRFIAASRQNPFLHRRVCDLSCQMRPPRISFTPVPLKARHDGWTPSRQRHFIELLAATKSVTRACKAVGMSAVTAYALRKKPGAESFAAAWDAALAFVADPGRRSPRAAQRLARLEARAKAKEVEEMHGPPVSSTAPAPASPALQALEALLSQLRAPAQAARPRTL